MDGAEALRQEQLQGLVAACVETGILARTSRGGVPVLGSDDLVVADAPLFYERVLAMVAADRVWAVRSSAPPARKVHAVLRRLGYEPRVENALAEPLHCAHWALS